MKSEIVDMQGNKHIIDFDNLQSCFINCDCMEALRKMPDNCVDLAICDPPYGGGASADAEDVFKGNIVGRFGGRFEKYLNENSGGVSAYQEQAVHGRVSTGKK